jgi:hypothetical protein
MLSQRRRAFEAPVAASQIAVAFDTFMPILKNPIATALRLSYNLFFDGRGVEQSGSSSGS